jgi:LuxR family quorum sensing-dependent transcriptional regulator
MPENQHFFSEGTRARIVDYAMDVERLKTPSEVLDLLHDIVFETHLLRVQGANRFSARVSDMRRIEIGKNVFIHKDIPRGWIEEWAAFVASGHPIGLMTARICLAPFTWTELSRMLDPVGADRWPFELALKYGMRDGYICPVGGRWLIAFCSPKVLDQRFTQQARGLLYLAASAAAIRLEHLVGDDPRRVGTRACLTPREQAVLRHASIGRTLQETAKALGVSEETVRTHCKKAQAKLGTRNRTHTVAHAMRELLII